MRLYRVTFVSGIAIGYVLGTHAGRERYDQIRRLVRSASDSPAVQQAAGVLHARATSMMKSVWSLAAAGGRQGVAKTRRRSPDSDRSAVDGHATSGNGSAHRPAGGNKRPFVPVNGDFGDHDLR